MDEVKKIYIAMVLDCSGSMNWCREATIDGSNKQIATIRENAEGMETFVSFYTFNHKVKCHYKNTSVNFLLNLTKEDYVCEGDTAMLEGVGEAITNLLNETDSNNPNNTYLVLTVSDGKNNRSPETHPNLYKWSRPELANLIKNCLDTERWSFSYEGENQDLSKIAEELNIPKGSVANYAPTFHGTEVAFAASARQTGTFLKMRKATPPGVNLQVKNYHSDSEEAIADYSCLSLEDIEQGKKATWKDKETV